VSLEEDLQAIKDAEKKAESEIEDAKKEAETINQKARETSKKEEEKAFGETREKMAVKEKALVDQAKAEGETIIELAGSRVEELKNLAAKNKKDAAEHIVEEILEK
jgi:vacuolar-type H+-ATPase subunit H